MGEHVILDKNINTVVTDKIVGIISRDEYLTLYNSNQIEDKQDICLISVYDPGNYAHPDTKIEGFHKVLQIPFWDLEVGFVDRPVITDEQGKELHDFITQNKDKKFLIHCSAGKSRSAGVGLALNCLLNHNGDLYKCGTHPNPILDHTRYSPNYKVRDTILKWVENT